MLYFNLMALYIYTRRQYDRSIRQDSSPVVLAIMWGGLVRPRSVDSLFYTAAVAMQQWAGQSVGLFMKLNSRKVILFLQHDYFVLI
jgi:hypothetical protein